MKHSLPLAPQFYVTAPQPCPYLADRVERKLFTGLQDANGQALNDALSKQGFRRSQNVLYRPACTDCSACISVRIRIADFKPTKSQKRTLRRNADMSRGAHTAWATDEQFDLFKMYLTSRHRDGGMTDMDVFEFGAMIEETPVRTRIIEYHQPAEHGGNALKYACLTDILDDGLSMVYSFFDPDMSDRSPGKYMILDHIEIAREMGLDYIYLGYWVAGSPKMDYKAQFSALELCIGGDWQPFDIQTPTDDIPCSGNDKTILEQVSNLNLPTVS
jgi:arginyl-tRNA--protein-N-Asp/Glu arginylyltransferase